MEETKPKVSSLVELNQVSFEKGKCNKASEMDIPSCGTSLTCDNPPRPRAFTVPKISSTDQPSAPPPWISTDIAHASGNLDFFGPYIASRGRFDYKYHKNYTQERQAIQDRIIFDMTHDESWITGLQDFIPRPWIIFTAGAMGAGKGRVIRWLLANNKVPKSVAKAVRVDPDEVKARLPETALWQSFFPESSLNVCSSLTHKESGFVTEILAQEALKLGLPVIVDGTLKDHVWYGNHFNEIRRVYPKYRLAIIYVVAEYKTTHSRAQARAIQTSRVVPEAIITRALLDVPRSVEILAPMADLTVTFNNDGNNEPPLLSNMTWEEFYDSWL